MLDRCFAPYGCLSLFIIIMAQKISHHKQTDFTTNEEYVDALIDNLIFLDSSNKEKEHVINLMLITLKKQKLLRPMVKHWLSEERPLPDFFIKNLETTLNVKPVQQ